ncbi:SARP family transcriptional regulator [Cnuibacter physcomitrellae]|uniref:Uncharacterized protein n=1 Tax=Cnuibacter physcomitrellae TaxID=1619308 RepID=A0A1X9LHX3_9MICO|nr:BTAD domain-containing putative transcriptional regulator [Cnuibacter physcomitrellae]ARJ04805.1 hypothetical protein B5808_05915 [Cnuibacter physcomitrellae]GGI41837.1 SARP family transcriptional regulator [Cnuibacter physcomitrellae]
MTGIDAAAPWSARLGVLGPVSAAPVDGTALVEASGPRAKALLTALLLPAPRAVTADRLIEHVWQDDPPRGAKAALQTLVSRTRAALGDDVVESTVSGYRLGVDRGLTDLGRVELLLERARSEYEGGAVVEASAAASAALALWRGEAGADLPPGVLADELSATAASLQDDLETLIVRTELELGHGDEAEAPARRLCERHPFDDTAHLLLMRCLDAAGRSTDALAVFAEFRGRVADAFGSQPAVELQQLNLDLLDREAAPRRTPRADDDRRPAPPPSSRRRLVRGLRAAPNPLLGRDRALDEIEALLAASRVVTVLGPGGIGKTRVAQEIAHRHAELCDAVVVVELAGVRTGDDVVFALGTALGIREVTGGRRLGDAVVRTDLGDRIRSTLDGLDAVLVLDNCEHIIDAAAEWAAALTSDLPRLRILATSRTPLAISSERVFALPPLGVESGSDGADAAVELFLARATAARPDASLPRDAVARLCARLDGLPLAIELAAARIRSMPLDEVERRLSNRFALLTTGDRAAPQRHRTLLAVIEWSWNLLSDAEQRALARLSEFADGFGLGAAAVVLAEDDGTPGSALGEFATQDLLDALISQSLVLVTERDSALRFRMLETVREFGRLQLGRRGELELARDRILAWAAGFAESTLGDLSGRTQIEAFRRVSLDEDNLLDALRRAMAAERPDVVVRVFAMLGYFWSLRSAHSEVIALSPDVFDAIRRFDPDEASADFAVFALVIIAATMVIAQERVGVVAVGRLRRLVDAHPPTDPLTAAMTGLVLSAGRLDRVEAVAREALDSADPHTVLLGSLASASSAENDGRSEEAERLARRAVSTAVSLGDTWGESMASLLLSQLHSQSGHPAEAIDWAHRARRGMLLLGAENDLRQLDWMIAINDVALGDLDEAEGLFEEVLTSSGSHDEVELRSIGLAGLAEIARARGDRAGALDLYRRSLSSYGSARAKASPWFRLGLASTLATMADDDLADPGDSAILARRLRARTLASLRSSRSFVDRPVLGSSAVGLGTWIGAQRFPDPPLPGSDRVRRPATFDIGLGLRLVALGEVLGARQDAPSLRVAERLDGFRAAVGAPAVEEARSWAAAIPDAERPELVAALLREPGPWSPSMR